MNNYPKLLQFLLPYKWLFVWAVVGMFAASLLEGFQLPMILPIIDRIFTDKTIILPDQSPEFLHSATDWLNNLDQKTLFYMAPLAVIVILILKNICILFYRILMNDISQKVMRDVRQKIYQKIHDLSLDYFSKAKTGELISRITYDVQLIENAVSYGLTDMFRESFMVTIYVIFAFTLNFEASVIIFFVMPAVIYPVIYIGKRLRKISRNEQEKMADINNILLETISGVKIVKAFSTEEYEIERFKARNEDYYKVRMKSIIKLLYLAPITEIFGVLIAVGIVYWLGRDVLSGNMSFGVFSTYLGSILLVIRPIKKIGNVYALVQKALAANDRIYDVLEAKVTVQEKQTPVALPEISKNIELKNVSFRYTETSVDVLKNIDVEIKKGELVAIVGPTGTGKTTLANLIPRFYDPTQGGVYIDGINLKDVSLEVLRKQIGIVTQESVLFNDTIANNICYGTQTATADQIKHAAKQAFAHRFIEKLPQGYDTIVGDRGFRLSGGEKQRISIARAILKNPPILILDEATSQLDSESEKYVQEALDELMEGRTVVAIAHRLSTIQKADKIIVLEGGHIVGLGPHSELLQSCALYKRLHDHQFQV